MPLGKPKMRFGAWLRVPHSMADTDMLRRELTIPNPAYYSAQQYGGAGTFDPEKAFLKQYHEDPEDPGALYVPRAHEMRWYRDGKVVYPPIKRERAEWPEDTIILGPNKWQTYDQEPAYDALVAPPGPSRGRLLVLGCGKGKSVISLKAAMKRGTPVAVIVDSNELADQWEKYIVDFCKLPKERIGRVQGKEFRWEGYPITVCMTQTLMQAKRTWPSNFRDYFGVVILDEIHVMGAPTFSRVVPLFSGERWGLTATPDRDDKLDAVFRMHLAPAPCFVDVEQVLVPEVILVDTGLENPDMYLLRTIENRKKVIKRVSHTELLSLPKLDVQRIADGLGLRRRQSVTDIVGEMRRRRWSSVPLTLTRVAKDKRRNQLILSWTRKLAAQGRKSLVLGNRTEQLTWLANHHGSDAGLLHGKVARDKRMNQLRDFGTVFAAQKMATKALDKVTLDTLVITSLDPQICTAANVQQSVGRIQRPHPDKKTIQVIVFVDGHSVLLRNQLRKLLDNLRLVLGTKVQITRVNARQEEEEL